MDTDKAIRRSIRRYRFGSFLCLVLGHSTNPPRAINTETGEEVYFRHTCQCRRCAIFLTVVRGTKPLTYGQSQIHFEER